MTKYFVEVENIEIDVGITETRKKTTHKCAFGIATGLSVRLCTEN